MEQGELVLTTERGAEIRVHVRDSVTIAADVPALGICGMAVTIIGRDLAGRAGGRAMRLRLTSEGAATVAAARAAAPCGHCGGSGEVTVSADGWPVVVRCRECAPTNDREEPARGDGWCERCESYCYGDCEATS